MSINREGIDLIKSFERLKLKAYRCSAGRPTIGYGATYYPSGAKVKMGDNITAMQAEKLLAFHIDSFEKDVDFLVKIKLNENQRSALVSFAFNNGSDIDNDTKAEGLGDSTLLKLVNKNPNDPAIRGEFMKWNKAGGKVLKGLVARRNEEANLYFKPINE